MLEDIPKVSQFYLDIRNDSVPLIRSYQEICGWMEHVLQPRATSYIYEISGEPVGWIDFDTHVVRVGELHQLYCKRGFTGRGIGHQLLEFAKQHQAVGLELFTFQANLGAQRFYSREGFVEIDRTEGYGNEEQSPDLLMRWLRPSPVAVEHPLTATQLI